jgi:hypothetical protein
MGDEYFGGSMRSPRFTDRQIEILKSLRDKATAQKKELLDQTLGETLHLSDIETVCQLINDEYLMKGINPDYNPNDYGRELERLLDAVNRRRLIRS